ncbi:hypothetical protein A3H26_02465 [candidate division WWE3 bacterium RIFCSPLOWO2_12_FULL_36_10]|uniref:Uncharacterized protein n=1 Tax=candidate division WWE3 bacterium RIFCSPLOWO2_12_FULL_36_10 TaxID=1802630 RepID=A0A1F4VJV1_UNCKA|nr:MAG: hypothetical protein A3H26_02465 [candidate division WWE3 bacterium RIFCSPLOWO2_12_FULL_36_10]
MRTKVDDPQQVVIHRSSSPWTTVIAVIIGVLALGFVIYNPPDFLKGKNGNSATIEQQLAQQQGALAGLIASQNNTNTTKPASSEEIANAVANKIAQTVVLGQDATVDDSGNITQNPYPNSRVFNLVFVAPNGDVKGLTVNQSGTAIRKIGDVAWGIAAVGDVDVFGIDSTAPTYGQIVPRETMVTVLETLPLMKVIFNKPVKGLEQDYAVNGRGWIFWAFDGNQIPESLNSEGGFKQFFALPGVYESSGSLKKFESPEEILLYVNDPANGLANLPGGTLNVLVGAEIKLNLTLCPIAFLDTSETSASQVAGPSDMVTRFARVWEAIDFDEESYLDPTKALQGAYVAAYAELIKPENLGQVLAAAEQSWVVDGASYTAFRNTVVSLGYDPDLTVLNTVIGYTSNSCTTGKPLGDVQK